MLEIGSHENCNILLRLVAYHIEKDLDLDYIFLNLLSRGHWQYHCYN